MITNLKQSFKNAPVSVRNELAKQFEPLVNKIVAQQHKKLHTDWDTIKSMAYEGLVQAMNTYEPGKVARGTADKKPKKEMDFKQYAGFMILNNIRNRSHEELNIVKLNFYATKQMKENEESTFVTVPISSAVRDTDSDKDVSKSLMNVGLYESAKFSDGDPFETMKIAIDTHIPKDDAEIFYRYFGLFGREETKLIDIAKELNVSSGRISQRLNKVVTFVRNDSLLCESLASLMSK